RHQNILPAAFSQLGEMFCVPTGDFLLESAVIQKGETSSRRSERAVVKLQLVRNKVASECVARFETLWRAKEGFDDLCAERGCEHWSLCSTHELEVGRCELAEVPRVVVPKVAMVAGLGLLGTPGSASVGCATVTPVDSLHAASVRTRDR